MENMSGIMEKLDQITAKLEEISEKVEGCFDLCGQSVDTLVTMDTEYSQIMHELTKGPEQSVLIFRPIEPLHGPAGTATATAAK